MRAIGISALERLEALVANDALYACAEAVPEQDRSVGGRPRQYPTFMWVLFDALLSVYGSGRRVEAELAHPLVWGRLCQLVTARFPHQPNLWLPLAPMRRHHYLYGRTRYLADPMILAQVANTHREIAVGQARSVGLLDPDGPGSWTHPDLSRCLYADGKVITPLFKAKPGERLINTRTGEIRYPRSEPDASLHIEGTGEGAWGCKFVLAATRDLPTNSRFILDAAFVPTSGAEASIAVDMFTRLRPLTSGAQAVIYDTALRGVHHQTLLRDLGLLTINRVAAASGSRKQGGGKGRTRVEKSTFVEAKTVDTLGGPREVKLFAKGGQIGLSELTDTGELTFTALERIRTHRTQSQAGTYRWYNDYRLPADHGAGTITVRLHGNDEDRKRKFNRTENVRPIPPGDRDFERLYRRRNDAESINRHLDDTLRLRRAHSIGHLRQTLNVITYALGINALALHLHCQRHAPPTAA
jgi:hypothetical protein